MGFKVTTMHNVPAKGMEYYIYILEPSWSHRYKKWFDQNFDFSAKELGSNAAIIRGWDEKLTYEVVDFILKWAKDSKFRALLHHTILKTVSLLIAKGDIFKTEEPIILIPIANPDDESENSDTFISKIMNLVVTAIKNENIQQIAQEIGFIRIPLKSVKQGAIYSTLRYLNKVLLLQPNVAGIGANLNAAIEPLLNGIRE